MLGHNPEVMLLQLVVVALFQSHSAISPTPRPGHPILIPTEYRENRFVAVPTTETGRKLRFYVDSAGACILASDAAGELKLPITTTGGDRTCSLPSFRPNAYIPAPIDTPIRVVSREGLEDNVGSGLDGMLGPQWFGGYTWTLDYPAKKLYWRAPGDLPKHSPEHEEKLYFKTDAKGVRDNNFARIQIEVDGAKISFTVDTGAE